MKKLFFCLYAAILLGFTFWSYLYVDWHLELLSFSWYKNLQSALWYFSLNQRIWSASLYILIIFLLYTIYFLLLLFVKQNKIKVSYLVVLSVMTTGILFFSHPALSHDIFNYMMSAKIVTHYQENPWVVMPIEFISEPMLNFLHAGNKIVLYGPIWIFLTLIPSWLGQNIFLLTYALFKLLTISFYLGLLLLIYKINHLLDNKEKILNLVLFALNPLVVIETFSSSHNDVVMMFFALLSFYLLSKRKFIISAVCLLLSIGIKYSTIFLLPVYLFTVYQTWENREINYDKIFFCCALSMYVMFFLSPLREELYPWYLIWPLSFLALLNGRNKLKILTIALSFGLLLRYVPFMLTYSWFGVTPIIKKLATILPPLIVVIFYLLRSKGKHRGFHMRSLF